MKRRPFLIVSLLIAVGIGVFGWRIWVRTSPPAIFLSDGSRLEFLSLTAGTNCSFHYGPPWQRLVAYLPGSLGRKFSGGGLVWAGGNGGTNVVFWFVRRGGRLQTNTVTAGSFNALSELIRTGLVLQPGSSKSVVSVVPAYGLRINLKDEQGDGVPGYWKSSEQDLPDGEVAMFWSVQEVPLHSPTLKLCLYDFARASGAERIGEILLPNPLYRKEP